MVTPNVCEEVCEASCICEASCAHVCMYVYYTYHTYTCVLLHFTQIIITISIYFVQGTTRSTTFSILSCLCTRTFYFFVCLWSSLLQKLLCCLTARSSPKIRPHVQHACDGLITIGSSFVKCKSKVALFAKVLRQIRHF